MGQRYNKIIYKDGTRYRKVIFQDGIITCCDGETFMEETPEHCAVLSFVRGFETDRAIVVTNIISKFGKPLWWRTQLTDNITRVYYLFPFDTQEDAALFKLKHG